MKDYSNMSDFEVNSAVHNFALGLGYDIEFLGNDVIEWRKDGETITTSRVDYTKSGLRDYCSNPSDAWQIIFENNIATRPLYIRDEEGRKIVGWEAKFTKREFPRNTIGWDDKNPLRAAMIVYLMMKDEE